MILLQAQSGTASLIMFGLIFVVMYFFMIRPQIKKQKAENQYRASLKMGDKIITIGGIQGKIIEIGKSSVVIEVYGVSKLKVLKSAVSMSGESEIKTK
jgi:preprotein translocase subunit YajC